MHGSFGPFVRPNAREPRKVATYTIRDSRICKRCGARAGRCSHLPADTYQAELHVPGPGRQMTLVSLEAWELEFIKRHWEDWTTYRIAAALNRSRGSVTTAAERMGLRKKY